MKKTKIILNTCCGSLLLAGTITPSITSLVANNSTNVVSATSDEKIDSSIGSLKELTHVETYHNTMVDYRFYTADFNGERASGTLYGEDLFTSKNNVNDIDIIEPKSNYLNNVTPALISYLLDDNSYDYYNHDQLMIYEKIFASEELVEKMHPTQDVPLPFDYYYDYKGYIDLLQCEVDLNNDFSGVYDTKPNFWWDINTSKHITKKDTDENIFHEYDTHVLPFIVWDNGGYSTGFSNNEFFIDETEECKCIMHDPFYICVPRILDIFQFYDYISQSIDRFFYADIELPESYSFVQESLKNLQFDVVDNNGLSLSSLEIEKYSPSLLDPIETVAIDANFPNYVKLPSSVIAETSSPGNYSLVEDETITSDREKKCKTLYREDNFISYGPSVNSHNDDLYSRRLHRDYHYGFKNIDKVLCENNLLEHVYTKADNTDQKYDANSLYLGLTIDPNELVYPTLDDAFNAYRNGDIGDNNQIVGAGANYYSINLDLSNTYIHLTGDALAKNNGQIVNVTIDEYIPIYIPGWTGCFLHY